MNRVITGIREKMSDELVILRYNCIVLSPGQGWDVCYGGDMIKARFSIGK